jgi:outer membrane protein assembly factor BamD
MMHRNTDSNTQLFSSISPFRTALTTGITAAALLATTLGAYAQAADPTAAAAAAEAQAAATQTGATQPKADITLSNQKPAKSRKKDEKVISSKDTRQENKKLKRDNALAKMDPKLPDKSLYDKAEDAIKHGRFDVGRLDLQTLLNTYPDSQYMMRAKLAIADSWYHEGGTAALTQAEQEYKDFITFFPNAPEAAEAQMRVGDIYFKQMDKPDRDYAKTVSAEQEYRLMLQQFPESVLVPQAQQRLREVQEVLAARDASIATFYAERTPPNWPGAIARYQTVVDTYPLYSRMDEVLIGLGDAYEAEAKFVRTLRLPEDGKARLIKLYDDEAIGAWSKVVLEHSAAVHVDDARDRLTAMNVPIPTPSKEQEAASAALEASRGQYTLKSRATLLFLSKSDTVPAATIGEPTLDDAKPTLAPSIVRQSVVDFQNSMGPSAAAQPAATGATQAANAPAAADGSAPAAAGSAPLSLQEVPAANSGSSPAPVVTNVPQTATPAATSTGNSMGIEIVRPDAATPPATAPATPPAFPGTSAAPAQPKDTTGGIGPVGPKDATPLAPIEKAAKAPDVINDAAGTSNPPVQATPANGKKPKVECDKNDESCSKHKPKKGLGKLNPF